MRRLSPLLLALAACSGNAASSADASAMPGDAATVVGLDAQQPLPFDAALPGEDAGVAPDASSIPADASAPAADAALPPDAGLPCTFNSDCPPNERCDELAGFLCTAGPRGTGQNGVDPCGNSNDCDTALCVEGWPAGTYYCSGPCSGDAGCGPKLPRCIYVSFLGDICARTVNP
jgi:hypothetical protein